MLVPDTPPPADPGAGYLREKLRESKESAAHLDVLLRETLKSKKSPAEKQAGFYGPICDAVGRTGVQVYTDGSCFNNGTPHARAGAGVYFGPGNKNNASLRVPGEQSNNRGELFAILYSLSSAESDKSLTIYSDSQHSIRSIVYWAPNRAEAGWNCANADILQDIVSWIKFRTAPLRFIYVKAHAGNSHNEAADAAAKAGA
ncbi:ribonuclease H-like domain-containing protein, partial [Mycena olivaceomarginata]